MNAITTIKDCRTIMAAAKDITINQSEIREFTATVERLSGVPAPVPPGANLNFMQRAHVARMQRKAAKEAKQASVEVAEVIEQTPAEEVELVNDSEIVAFCVEVHRYLEPNRFGFHYLELDTTGTWNIRPFGDERRFEDVNTKLHNEDNAARARRALIREGYEPKTLDKLSPAFLRYVIHQQCPLEWQSDLDKGNGYEYVTVWVQVD